MGAIFASFKVLQQGESSLNNSKGVIEKSRIMKVNQYEIIICKGKSINY